MRLASDRLKAFKCQGIATCRQYEFTAERRTVYIDLRDLERLMGETMPDGSPVFEILMLFAVSPERERQIMEKYEVVCA